MQKLQELEQDGSPFTVMGGRHGEVKGQIFTAAWCPVSAPVPVGPLSSHFTFPYLTPPPGSDSALHLKLLTILFV